jgi:hypothetical protein
MKSLFVVLLSTTLFSQCPIEIINHRYEYVANWNDGDGGEYQHMEWINTSSKAIKAVRFSIDYADAFGTVEETKTLTDERLVQPGKKRTTGWDWHYEYKLWERRPKEVWLDRVLFTDGTTWEDTDDTHDCPAPQVQHRKLGGLAWETKK